MAADKKFYWDEVSQVFRNRVSHEPIPDDEPVMLFRARDIHALATICDYRDKIKTLHHRQAVTDLIDEFMTFTLDHPERMKEPGITFDMKLSTDLKFIKTPEAIQEALDARPKPVANVREALALAKELDECAQTAGAALDYPWYKDDQKNFPGTTEEDGVCIGEHTSVTIVQSLAQAYELVKAKALELEDMKILHQHWKSRAKALEDALREAEAATKSTKGYPTVQSSEVTRIMRQAKVEHTPGEDE